MVQSLAVVFRLIVIGVSSTILVNLYLSGVPVGGTGGVTMGVSVGGTGGVTMGLPFVPQIGLGSTQTGVYGAKPLGSTDIKPTFQPDRSWLNFLAA